MTNVLLASPELSDNAVITGTQGMGDMNVGNLKKRSLKVKYRTSSEAEINIDLSAAKDVNCVALIGHNGTGSVTVKAGTTSDCTDYTSGSLNLISGDDIGEDKNLFIHLLDETYRYWKLEISHSGDYFEAGRLYISNAFIPEKNAEYGFKEGLKDNSRVTRTMSGEPNPLRRQPFKTVDFSFGFLSRAEANSLYDFDKRRGVSRDVLYVFDATSENIQRSHIYGLITQLEPIELPYHEIYKKRYQIEEIPA